MFYALALAALASIPGQGGQLKITNVRLTIGELGPTRPNAKFLPGDILFLAFDINGITANKEGNVRYKLGTRVTDSKGKLVFNRAPEEIINLSPLRSNVIPARAFIFNGLDTEAGTYTMEVTVEDPEAKAKETITTKFEVMKRDFGIIVVYTSYDDLGVISAPTIGVAGQKLIIQYAVVGFERDPKTKQPNIEFQYQFLDGKGMALLAEPIKQYVDRGVDEKIEEMHLRYPLNLNQPGKFIVKITATDKVTKKTSTFELPITVIPAP